MIKSTNRYGMALFLVVLYAFLPKVEILVGTAWGGLSRLIWWTSTVLFSLALVLLVLQWRYDKMKHIHLEKVVNFLYIYYGLALLFHFLLMVTIQIFFLV